MGCGRRQKLGHKTVTLSGALAKGVSRYSLTWKLGDLFLVRDAHLQGHYELALLALRLPVLTSPLL